MSSINEQKRAIIFNLVVSVLYYVWMYAWFTSPIFTLLCLDLTASSSQLPKRIFCKIGIATLGSYFFRKLYISTFKSVNYLFHWMGMEREGGKGKAWDPIICWGRPLNILDNGLGRSRCPDTTETQHNFLKAHENMKKIIFTKVPRAGLEPPPVKMFNLKVGDFSR